MFLIFILISVRFFFLNIRYCIRLFLKMSSSKYFQSVTGKYAFSYSQSRFVSRISVQNVNSKRLLSDLILSTEWNKKIHQVHPTYSRLNFYSSQASLADQLHKKSTLTHLNDHLITFEDMLFETPVPQEDMLTSLQKCKTLSEQMEMFSSTMALTSKDIENRKKFCEALELKIKPFFKDCKIRMYGSSVNCFGFKGCDVDMTFQTSIDLKGKVSSLDHIEVPSVSEVVGGKVPLLELSKLPPDGKLLFIYNLFLEYYKESSKRIVFVKEVPLVRFHHDKFNLKCDLTINNGISLDNSKLLYLYAKIDKRVASFIRNIQGWARSAELIGKRGTFNTYSINLLSIHFLQTRSPPVIPSAENILISKHFESADMMDNNSFLDLLKNLPPSNNTQPLDELLKEFFFYYLFFDFTRIISPLTGTSIPRKEYISKKDCKFIVNTLCVQDPLDVSNNVAKLVQGKMFLKLYSEFITVCKMFQDNVISTPSAVKWGLMNILNKPSKYDFRNADVRQPVHFTLPCLSQSTADRTAFSLQSSFTEMSRLLLNVIEHALLFECGKPLEQDEIFSILKRQDKLVAELKIKQNANMSSETMVEHFKKVNAENELIWCRECKVSKNVWTGRELVKLDASNLSSDLLNREHLKSQKIAGQNDKNTTSKDQKKMSHSYLLECYIASKTPEPSIIVYFRPLPEQLNQTYYQKLSVLGIFFKDYVPKLMKSSKIE